MGAFRSLFPVFTNPSLPSRRKLQVYAQIVLAILLYGSESQVFTSAQIIRFNSLHYKLWSFDKSFKLKALITIESFTPLRRTVEINSYSPLPTVMPLDS